MLEREKRCHISADGRYIKDRFNEEVPANFVNAKDKPFLIILDDLLNEVYSKNYVNSLRKAAITGISVSF